VIVYVGLELKQNVPTKELDGRQDVSQEIKAPNVKESIIKSQNSEQKSAEISTLITEERLLQIQQHPLQCEGPA
jgi:hypothetical protein